MIPRLYLENETNFNHNGIGALTESLSAVVVEEANGIFTLELRYPISGRWFSEITKLRLIKALTNLGEEEHIFRIDDIVKSSDDKMVTILASSKSNELAGHIFTEFKDTGQASQIMTRMKSKIAPPTTYNFVSDMNTEIKVEWFMRNVLNSILGQEGSMVDKLGGGELRRTNDTIYLYRRRGNENVARVSETKNLRGLTITESTKGLITRIQPYIRLQETNSNNETVEKVIIGDIVSSPLVDNYPLQIVVPVDFGEYELTNKAELDAKAKTYFTSMNPDSDKPKTELEIDLLQISDSSEYARFKHFEKIKLFDTVTVYAPRYGVDTLVKIVRVEFDVLREKVISLKAGQPKSSYSQALEKTYANKIDDKLSGINDKINIVQMSADGKNKVFTGPNEPDISISSEGDTWFKVLGNGEMEMYIFDGAYWQVVINANTSKEILDKIDQAETDIAQNILDIDAALDKATQAELDAGFSKDLAEEAKSLGVTASSLASEAKTNANKAMTDAQEAIRQVEINEGVVADASADATEAKRLAGLAEGNSQEALTKANASFTDASKALTDATKAFNKSFKSSAIAYATSTNGSTPPTTGWGTTVPSPSPDVYIWTRTTILLNDNTPVVSYSVGKIGAKGDKGLKGDTGGQGIPGVNAPTIKSVVQQYYLSTSKTTQTGGSWVSTVPVWSSGKYYWVRVVTTYSNDTTSTSTPVLDNALNDSLVTALEVKTANQNLSTTVTQHTTLIEGKANSTTVDALTGRVTTAEGSISTIAGQVELKANSTDVQTLTGRVTTAEGKITTQAGQIALKANTTDVNTLTGRVTTAEGNITTQAGQIALKANKSVVDTLTGRVTATEASIKVTDGKVTTLTTKTDGNTTSIGQLQTGYDGLRSTVTNVDWMARTNGALQLTPDPTFLTSSNRIHIYNNNGNTNVTVKRVQVVEGQPTGSPYILEVATTGSPTSPGLGGVVYSQYSRANAIFMIKFTAKIPTGYTVYHAMNLVGIGAKVTWVTSREGTGTWTEYAYVTECGSSGSFSKFGYIYLSTGVAPVTWYIAKYELFDISKSQQQAFSDLQQNIDGFKTTVANTYADKTTVTQLAGQVELKATKTDVDALTGRVTTAEGKITTQAGQIDLKANTTTVNTLTGRVSTAEGNITTQAGQIALKANQSTVDTLTGRVSTTEAKITATDGKVTTLTTKTDGNTTSIGKLQTSYTGLSSTVTQVKNNLEGMEIGGRNLLRNTSNEKTVDRNFDHFISKGLELGPLTYTVWLKANRVTSVAFYINDDTGQNRVGLSFASGVQLTTEYKKYTFTRALTKFTGTESDNIRMRVYGLAGDVITGKEAKLEKGNKSTDWSPAPEDMATVTQFSSLEQTVKGIQTTVGNKAEQSQVTQLAGQWSATVAKVDGHTGQITNLGEQINLRVKKDDLDNLLGVYNLLPNSSARSRNSNGWNSNVRVVGSGDNFEDGYAFKYVGAAYVGSPYMPDLKAGKYTIVINYKANTVTRLHWRLTDKSTTKYVDIINKTSVTSNVTKEVVTITLTSDFESPYLDLSVAGLDYIFTDLMVIKGEYAPEKWIESSVDNAITQINLSTEGVLIQGKNIWLDGNTKINNAVIKTAHIADLAVSGAKIANASISSAKIISLDASKITANRLDVITANTGDLSVTGNLTMATDNTLIIGSYNYTEVFGTSYVPRKFIGDSEFGRRYIAFYGGVYTPESTFKGYAETYYGLDYFKMRWYNSHASKQLRSRIDMYEGQIEFGNSFGTPHTVIGSDGIKSDKTAIISRITTPNHLASFRINDDMPNGMPRLQLTNGGAGFQISTTRMDRAEISVGGDGSPRVWFERGVYDRTYSYGANMHVTGAGTIGRSVSARKYKTDIQSEYLSKAKNILQISPSSWYDKEALRKGKPLKRYYGFIADEFHEIGLTEVVQYGTDGQIEGLAYDRISMYHNVILQGHERQLSTVTQQLTTVATERLQHTLLLESKLLSLEKTVLQLQQEIERLK